MPEAIIEASYVHLEFKPGLKVARVHLEFAQEKAAYFLEAFGTPDRVSPVQVAVARLQIGPHVSPPVSPFAGSEHAHPIEEPAEGADKRTRFKDMSPSNQAAIKLMDITFIDWICGKYPDLWSMALANLPLNYSAADVANGVLKHILGITSKKELDTHPEKAEAFARLLADFDFRDRVR